MHGLVNRSLQCFVRDTYGQDVWERVARRVDIGPDGFESMLIYDDAITTKVIEAAADELNRVPESLLEDLGTYLVSHPNSSRLRRLLRFGGESFVDFLHSLDELPERARLAVPDLALPALELRDSSHGAFSLFCDWHIAGAGHVLVGVLRAMADDYGALVLLDYVGRSPGRETISIDVMDSSFTEGRSFELAADA